MNAKDSPHDTSDQNKAIDEIILEMQTRISDAWQACEGAEDYDADEMFEKYGDETDAAERNAHAKLKALLVEARIDELTDYLEKANTDPKHDWDYVEDRLAQLKEKK